MDYQSLKKSEVKELSGLLETKLQSLEQEIRDFERELTDDKNQDEQSAADAVDRSSFEEGIQRLQLVLNEKVKLKNEVRAALERVADGSYGFCEESEEPIGFSRLKAQPWTRYSLEAQVERENRIRQRAAGRSPSEFY